ncbi:MAG TPA: transporter [Caldimonas sp.]|nr:transporter [Caldimonas sp.]HEX4233654.1 transporter [Caldimonas sp.]
MAILGASAAPLPAFAAHPLQSEDTGTQGAGNVEIENGMSSTNSGGSTTFVYQPQVSYGLAQTIDLIVRPSWLETRSPGNASTRGLGDTTVDAKWRFYGEAPWSFATRAGVTLATSEHDLGLPHGEASAHAILVCTFDAAPYTIHGNVSFTHNPRGSGGRAQVTRLSAAVMWAANDQLILTGDAGAESASDPAGHAWPATLLAGAIYTVRPGLDVDIGYQNTAHAAMTARQWLLGLTYRFAP